MTPLMSQLRYTALLLASMTMSTFALGQSLPAGDRVVFVCEHGSVKSVMAATLFNRSAEKRGSALRAVSRGVTPDSHVPVRIVDALKADGIDVAAFKPRPISEKDTANARRVIGIGVDPASLTPRGTATEAWTDVPDSSNYPAARDALQRHVDALLDELRGAQPKEGARTGSQ
jgi:arsenate reductase